MEVHGYVHCGFQGQTCFAGPWEHQPANIAFSRIFHVAYGNGPFLSEEFYAFGIALGPRPITCDGAQLGLRVDPQAQCLVKPVEPRDLVGVFNVRDCGQWGSTCASNGLAFMSMRDSAGGLHHYLIWGKPVPCVDRQGRQARCQIMEPSPFPDFLYNGQGAASFTLSTAYPNGQAILAPYLPGDLGRR